MLDQYCTNPQDVENFKQALKYDRVNDIVFDYGIFTNLTQDHIGENEHDSMEDYVSSKAKLFNQCNHGVFNIDDKYFYDMVQGGDASINTFGYNEKADLRAIKMDLLREKKFIGIELTTEGVINDKFTISTPGTFSSYNAMAAILTCHMLGIDTKYIKKALSNFYNPFGNDNQINPGLFSINGNKGIYDCITCGSMIICQCFL
jgi:UDP-N-acetylmuramoyl-L-alanyl-D-glutamate--2,6-diaminopimelate ligase